MSDTYKAVYDAMQSANLSWHIERIKYEFDCAIDMSKARFEYAVNEIQDQMTRPSVLFKPSLALDGNQYYVLYGSNLQEGIAGFGDTADAAMLDFDTNWKNQKCMPV